MFELTWRELDISGFLPWFESLPGNSIFRVDSLFRDVLKHNAPEYIFYEGSKRKIQILKRILRRNPLFYCIKIARRMLFIHTYEVPFYFRFFFVIYVLFRVYLFFASLIWNVLVRNYFIFKQVLFACYFLDISIRIREQQEAEL